MTVKKFWAANLKFLRNRKKLKRMNKRTNVMYVPTESFPMLFMIRLVICYLEFEVLGFRTLVL